MTLLLARAERGSLAAPGGTLRGVPPSPAYNARHARARPTPASHPTACSTRSKASASVAMAGSWRSTATKTACIRSAYTTGRRSIVKFYRPGRWSDEAILEEHAFVAELAGHEIPVVAPLALDGKRTLYAHQGFRFSVYPKHGGRVPELGDLNTLEWMGRFIGRIHAVGAVRPFRHRPTLDIASFGEAPRDFLLGGDWVAPDLVPAYQSIVEQAILGVRRCFERAGGVATLRLHGDCYAGNVLWTHDGPHFVDFDDSRMGPAVQDLWMLLSGDRAAMTGQLAAVLAGYEDFNVVRYPRAILGGGSADPAPHPLFRLDRAALGRPGIPRGLSVVRYAALLAGQDPGIAGTSGAHGRAATRLRLRTGQSIGYARDDLFISPERRYVYHARPQSAFFDPLTLALSRRERGSKEAIYDRGQ